MSVEDLDFMGDEIVGSGTSLHWNGEAMNRKCVIKILSCG